MDPVAGSAPQRCRAGLPLHTVPEFATQFAFVQAGLAAAVMPRLAAVWAPSDVALVPLTPVLRREVLLIRRASYDGPAIRAGQACPATLFAELAAANQPA